MPIKRPQLINGEIYHLILKGVDEINIFRDQKDYYRAIHDFFEFNDEATVDYKCTENSSLNIDKKKRKLLVKILAFCFMPNHIHLLVYQVREGGISKLMRKFGAGYVGYFNHKHKRQGHLFQGRFRAVHIKTDEQLKCIFTYIHTNPASLVDSGWKDGKIKDAKKVIDMIENYKWSSYQDYLEKKNFPSVTQRSILEQIMTKREWQKYVTDWVYYKDINNLSDIILE